MIHDMTIVQSKYSKSNVQCPESPKSVQSAKNSKQLSFRFVNRPCPLCSLYVRHVRHQIGSKSLNHR